MCVVLIYLNNFIVYEHFFMKYINYLYHILKLLKLMFFGIWKITT